MPRFPLAGWFARGVVQTIRRSRLRRAFAIERLEERCVPVVGFDSLAPEVNRGDALDGVVLVEQGESYGTGSLLYTGRHVLTAAHVVDGEAGKTLTFQLNRGSLNIDIAIEIPAALYPAAWQPGGLANQGSDLGLLTLIDQVVQQADRHLVAPFGAERYSVFQGSLQGAVFTMVGYGRTGTGQTGNQVDEVQRIQLSKLLANGTFTLSFGGATTTALSPTADRLQVQQALAALPTIGEGNVEVSDRGLSGGAWEVRFLRRLGNQDVQLLTGTATGGVQVTVSELFAGGQPDLVRVKREGQNQINDVDGQFLRFDFDDGTAAHNSMGDTGLGSNREAGLERGDSGSPLLVESAGGFALGGIFSYFATGGSHDLNNFATPDGSFGGTGTYIGLQQHLTDFLYPGLRGDYHLVLDMHQQVLGLDGQVEQLTIRADREGGDLVLSVYGSSDPRFNGIYYRAPIDGPDGRILSLTLRGSDDNETFILDDDLGLADVTVDGRGGSDTLEVDTGSANQWRISGRNLGTVNTNHLTFRDVENLRGGLASDSFAFEAGGQITGDVQGGFGDDSLDYRAFDHAVTTQVQGASSWGYPTFFFNPSAFNAGYQGLSTAIGGLFRSIESVVGSSALDTLVGSDSSNSWQITRANGGMVNGFNFGSMENLLGGQWTDAFVFYAGASVTGRVDGGLGIDEFDYSLFDSTIAVNLNTSVATAVGQTFASVERLIGSALVDSLVGPNSINFWNISGTNEGMVNGQFTFIAVEHLTGGGSRDVYAFLQQGSITGQINAGAGQDWLDYHLVTESVSVDLSRSLAARTGGIKGIENVVGSLGGNDNLVGNLVRNILVSRGNGNALRGGDGRDLLIGGVGRNFLAGGKGDDIAIAGSTAYDRDFNALEAFMAEWSRTIAYNTRVNNLLQGKGLTGKRRLLAGAILTGHNTSQVQTNRAPSPTVSYQSMIYGNLGQDFFAVRNLSLVADLERKRERAI